MTDEEFYELSFYREVTVISEKKNITMVRHAETGDIFVKKELSLYNSKVYEMLRQMKLSGMPRICFQAQDEDALVVIEEFINGRTIERVVDETGVISEEGSVRIAMEIARILEQLHGHTPALIHRDIKPSNVMISNDGRVYLIDMNASKVVDEGENRDTVLVGTKEFAAPEQYGFGSSDNRTDIYGLGKLLCYMLTGGTDAAKISNPKIKSVVDKATAINKADRYGDVQKMSKALGSLAGDKRLKLQRPVGFRSMRFVNMLLGGAYYAFLIWYLLTVEYTDGSDLKVSTAEAVVDNIYVAFILLWQINWWGDYANLKSVVLKKVSNKLIRLILSVLIWVVVMIVVTVIYGIIVAVFQ